MLTGNITITRGTYSFQSVKNECFYLIALNRPFFFYSHLAVVNVLFNNGAASKRPTSAQQFVPNLFSDSFK